MTTKKRSNPNQRRIYAVDGIAPCLNKMDGGGREPYIIQPVFCDMSEGAEKRQNGRRMKGNGEPMFTLTGQERHGVMISTPDGMAFYAVWYEKYQRYIAIRKLTPRECFRLQGWSDEYFDRAELVNSDSQLYKQAGNGVTVPVIYEIAKRIG